MIEILLQAERALSVGLVDQAERLYRQASDADPHNSIAVVGIARVALERGDEPEAWRQAQRALMIDPENVAAQRLADRLEEVWAYRGASLPDAAAVESADAPAPADVPETADMADVPDPVQVAETTGAAESVVIVAANPEPAPPDTTTAPEHAAAPDDAPRPERSTLGRLFRRNRP